MQLKNKTILITGATGGIGSILATHLAHEGAHLLLLGRNSGKLASLLSHLHNPSHHTPYTCDLTSRSSRTRVTSQIRKIHPQLDILVHAAGIGIYKPYLKLTAKDWYSSYELNVHTPFFLSQSLQPALTASIGSCSAIQYRPTRSLYNSTKAALRSLTLCLSQEQPGGFVHITLDSTLTSFGSLTLTEKQAKAKTGKNYLSADWVAKQIISILKDKHRQTEYVLSPDCYDHCGVWQRPELAEGQKP